MLAASTGSALEIAWLSQRRGVYALRVDRLLCDGRHDRAFGEAGIARRSVRQFDVAALLLDGRGAPVIVGLQRGPTGRDPSGLPIDRRVSLLGFSPGGRPRRTGGDVGPKLGDISSLFDAGWGPGGTVLIAGSDSSFKRPTSGLFAMRVTPG